MHRKLHKLTAKDYIFSLP